MQRQLQAHLRETGDGALGDLRRELVVVEVGGEHHRALVLVAGIDDRVELLQDPVGGALGADVIDVEEIDGREPVEQVDVRALSPMGVPDLVEQPR